MATPLRAKQPGATLASLLLYECCRRFALLALRLLWGVDARGMEHVPRSGPFLIVANHQSYLDPPAIGGVLTTRNLDFVAKRGLFRLGPFTWLIRGLNSIPVGGDGAGDLGSIKEVLARLQQSRATLIFPEGQRSPDGSMQEFQRGALLLIKRARCPVVPCAIDGPYEIWPRHRAMPTPWRRRIVIRYGHPIGADELLALGNDGAVARLRAEIAGLLDEARRAGTPGAAARRTEVE
jgi:1-acyl-sn-glycerol-3-phosphate acyltransferase